jgi:hypothetical protein
MSGPDPRKARLMQGPKKGRAGLGSLNKKEKEDKIIILSQPKEFDDNKIMILTQPQEMKTGGRAGYKMGSKCKLATKGKGRAYGKNS